ncbi:MAG: helix-turn-helix transcriptional regulator [Halorientalis sp.]
MSRLLSLAFVCLLLVGLAVGPGYAGATDDHPNAPIGPQALSSSQQFASATFNIEVYENGSARWTFHYYTASLNDSEREQFRSFADRFESQETDLWTTFQERARALVAAGTNTTGRNMTASGFHRSASLDSVGNRGQVQLSFMWHEFARQRGERVIVGDVFENEFYIAPNQWLVFETGPNLAFDASRIDPKPDEYAGRSINESDTITWFGEQRFPDNRPRVVFAPANQSTSAPSTTTANATSPAGAGGGTGSGLQWLLLGVAVLAVIGAAAAWQSGLLGSTTTDDGPDDGDTDASTGADGGAGATASPGPAEAAASEPAVSEEELLSDEDRVVKMLETNGGRMKQANIVDETGWSKSKVSMLLSDMEDDEVISKLRVGRENIVSLSGHEPDAAGSPFDDE